MGETRVWILCFKTSDGMVGCTPWTGRNPPEIIEKPLLRSINLAPTPARSGISQTRVYRLTAIDTAGGNVHYEEDFRDTMKLN